MLIHAFNWKKLSLCAALASRWDGRRARLWFQMKPGSYDGEKLIGFLTELRAEFRAQKLILVWDGLPAHKSRGGQEYLRRQRHWVREERLPGYAPELNPVESVWENVKGQEMANLCAESLAAAGAECRQGLNRVRRQEALRFPSSAIPAFLCKSCHCIMRDSVDGVCPCSWKDPWRLVPAGCHALP